MQGKKNKEGGESIAVLFWMVRELTYKVSLSRDLKGGDKPCGHREKECSL